MYTRNRNFRLFLSSKLGKTTRLRLAQENVFKVAVLTYNVYSSTFFIYVHHMQVAREEEKCKEVKKEPVSEPVYGNTDMQCEVGCPKDVLYGADHSV